MEIYAGQVVTLNGMQVRIVDVDSDPQALVWGFFVEDPDQEVWFFRHEIGS